MPVGSGIVKVAWSAEVIYFLFKFQETVGLSRYFVVLQVKISLMYVYASELCKFNIS